MTRITDKDLEALCARLNRLMGTPAQPYVRPAGSDRHVAQIGNFHLSHAYGGVSLHQMHNDAGGVSCPLSGGHVPKRDLYERMHAYIRGIEDGRLAVIIPVGETRELSMADCPEFAA